MTTWALRIILEGAVIEINEEIAESRFCPTICATNYVAKDGMCDLSKASAIIFGVIYPIPLGFNFIHQFVENRLELIHVDWSQ
jgi:hypothetical protein